jgi:Carboxypeptidase regulatory-like domain
MRFCCVFRLLLLITCVTSSTLGQSTNATISGQVVDPSGRVIPDADIQILNEATGVQYSNKTNNSGLYTVPILPPGQYRIQVSKIGFKTLIKPDIILNVQSAVALNFTLPLGAASESVTVDAGTSLINITDASVGTVVDRKFVANIPLNGRSFQDLISLTPGVVTATPQTPSTSQGVAYTGETLVLMDNEQSRTTIRWMALQVISPLVTGTARRKMLQVGPWEGQRLWEQLRAWYQLMLCKSSESKPPLIQRSTAGTREGSFH